MNPTARMTLFFILTFLLGMATDGVLSTYVMKHHLIVTMINSQGSSTLACNLNTGKVDAREGEMKSVMIVPLRRSYVCSMEIEPHIIVRAFMQTDKLFGQLTQEKAQ